MTREYPGDTGPLPPIDDARQGIETRRLKAALRARLDLRARPADAPRLGRFVVLERIGQGGMGTVFSAFDPQLDRRVAVKLIRSTHHDPDAASRLMIEARMLAKLEHPNVVRVYDVGEVEDEVFVAMELVEGESLYHWAKHHDHRARGAWRRAVHLYAQAAEGLAAAHAVGMIHRDFKPANAMLGRDGIVRVLDFGLAWTHEQTQHAADATLRSPNDTPGAAVMEGTPGYIAPEQRHGGPLDHRADQYSLCVALYEAVMGARPHPTPRLDAATRHAPRWLLDVLHRGLATDPSQRFESMRALRAALLDDPARRRLRWLAVATGSAVVATAVGIGYRAGAVDPSDPCTQADARARQTWNESARASLRQGFEASGAEFASASAIAVDTTLGEYFERWGAEATDACRAVNIRGEQSTTVFDLRSACLDHAMLEASALVEVLRTPEAETVARAAEAAASLPAVAHCRDVQALRRGVVLPPASAVESASRLSAELASALALERTGHYERAHQAADAIGTKARADPSSQSLRPIEARALALRGRTHAKLARLRVATQDLERAVWLATRVRDDDTATASAIELIRVVGLGLAQPERGLAWVDRADALAERGNLQATYGRQLARVHARLRLEMHDDVAALELARAAVADPGHDTDSPRQRALTQTTLGRALVATGQTDLGLAAHQEAIATMSAALGAEHPGTLEIRNSVGSTLVKTDLDAAAQELHRAHAGLLRIYGPDHPSVANTASNLGSLAQRRGHLDEAARYYREAHDANAKSLGATHPKTLEQRRRIAMVLARQGQLREATIELEQTLALTTEHAPEGDPLHIWIPADLGGLELRQQRYAEAEQRLSHAIELGQQQWGSEDPKLAWMLANRSIARRKLGDTAQGLDDLQRVVRIRERAWGRDDPRLELTYSMLGNAFMNQETWDAAITWYRRAIEVAEPHYGPDDERLTAALVGWGRAHWRAGQPEAAIPLLRRAVHNADQGQDTVWHAWTRFNLGRARWDARRDRARARQLVQEAVRLYRALDPSDGNNKLYEARAWLDEHPASAIE